MRTFNIFIAAFLLMGIVLTNGYKGIVITDITAPLKESLISTFEEAVRENYTLVTPNNAKRRYLKDRAIAFLRLRSRNTTASDTDLATYWYKKWRWENFTSLPRSQFGSSLTAAVLPGNHTNGIGLVFLKSIMRMMDTWTEREVSSLINGTEYEFLKCNKTILVDTEQELAIRFAKLKTLVQLDTFGRSNNTNVTLSTGKESLLTVAFTISVGGFKWDKGLLAQRMSMVLSSGIYDQLKNMERTVMQRYYGRLESRSNEPSALNLNSNILTLFAVYSSCILLAVVWFTIELLCRAYTFLSTCSRRLRLPKIF